MKLSQSPSVATALLSVFPLFQPPIFFGIVYSRSWACYAKKQLTIANCFAIIKGKTDKIRVFIIENFERLISFMNRLKQNRAASFVAVTGVYVIAVVVGIMTYRALCLDWWLSLLLADIAATVATFAFSLIFKNASVYDPYRSVQPPVILVAFAVGKELTALGFLLLLVVSFWAIRLTANWAYTFANFAVSIPMADARQSRKEGFAEYKRQTRMLLPIKK